MSWFVEVLPYSKQVLRLFPRWSSPGPFWVVCMFAKTCKLCLTCMEAVKKYIYKHGWQYRKHWYIQSANIIHIKPVTKSCSKRNIQQRRTKHFFNNLQNKRYLQFCHTWLETHQYQRKAEDIHIYYICQTIITLIHILTECSHS